jgi:hypothetical protein
VNGFDHFVNDVYAAPPHGLAVTDAGTFQPVQHVSQRHFAVS